MFKVDSSVNRNAKMLANLGPVLGYYPAHYTTPEEELLACRKTAWLGCSLSFSPVYDIEGPDAVKLLNYVCVNRDFGNLKMDGSRHALLCNEKGQLLADGLLIRKGEESFRTYWLAPILAFYVDSLGMNVTGKWIFDEYFFQIDGPKSLEIMEAASKTDLHDMKFAAKRDIQIAGTDVTIIRLGMSGALAYEIHGDIENADKVYDEVLRAGEQFGIKQLGHLQYCRNHTQGGYPNQWIHYWYPWLSGSKEMRDYVMNCPYISDFFKQYPFSGSASGNIENAFVTPFDLKWDYLINYEHDFIGKDALYKISKNPPRTCVTLEWNAEDVGKAFATQFLGQSAPAAGDIGTLGDGADGFGAPLVIDKVLLNGEMVGISSGRLHDYYHKKMISLAFINKELSEIGTELTVLWGTPGTTQVEISATVARFPYYNGEYRNETFDVEKIPRPKF